MDNKNEKTFADLFSSSTENEETKKETFSDILNTNSNEPLEAERQQENSITFDNIFDSLPSQEENTSTELPKEDIEKSNETTATEQNQENTFNNLLAEEDKINLEESKEETQGFNSFNSFLEAEEEVYDANDDNKEEILPALETKPEEQTSFSDIFNINDTSTEETIQDNNDQAEDNLQNLENKDEEHTSFSDIFNENNEVVSNDNIDDVKSTTTSIPETHEDNDSFNSFLTEEKDNQAKKEVEEENKTISFEEIQNTDIIAEENKKENVEPEENKVLEDKDNQEVTETQELKEEVEQEPVANPFFQDEPSPQETESNTEEKEDTDNVNPFLNPNIDNETKQDIEKDTLENPFFNSEDTEKKQEEIAKNNEETTNDNSNNNENPFFNAENNNGETQSAGILAELDKKENKDLEPEAPKSTSPFFQEEEKPEVENPFFQQQINLIENQVPNNPTNNIDLTNTKHYDVKIVKKKEPLIKLILGVLSYAMFIFLLLIGVTLLVYVIDIKIRQSKGDYSAPTFNAYVVLTGSMLPEIQVKDVVITKKTEGKDLKEGDVITFASTDSRFAGTIITHRIIKKNPKTDKEGFTFQTKGDNNNVADSALVTEGNIFGKVILKIPKLGYLQEFLAADGGWIIVILIPCLAVISYDIVKLAKGLKRKKYKNIKVQK